jgi:hypothetical protein
MENNIKFQLEEIKKLYDSKSITESEYKSLKDEILFGNKEDSLLNKYKSPNKSDGIKSERNVFNEVKKGNNNVFENNNGFKKIGINILYFIVFFTLAYNIFKPNNKIENTVNEETAIDTTSAVASTPQDVCSICGKTFYHRGYQEVSEGQYEILKEGQGTLCSISCAKQATQNLMNSADNYYDNSDNSSMKDASIQHYGEYNEGSDGKIYENNKCGLCNGTGIEKNRSSLSDEDGRICPMCEGKGVRSY